MRNSTYFSNHIRGWEYIRALLEKTYVVVKEDTVVDIASKSCIIPRLLDEPYFKCIRTGLAI